MIEANGERRGRTLKASLRGGNARPTTPTLLRSSQLVYTNFTMKTWESRLPTLRTNPRCYPSTPLSPVTTSDTPSGDRSRWRKSPQRLSVCARAQARRDRTTFAGANSKRSLSLSSSSSCKIASTRGEFRPDAPERPQFRFENRQLFTRTPQLTAASPWNRASSNS